MRVNRAPACRAAVPDMHAARYVALDTSADVCNTPRVIHLSLRVPARGHATIIFRMSSLKFKIVPLHELEAGPRFRASSTPVDPDGLLRTSIATYGILEPLVVSLRGPNGFAVIDGVRRVAIARDIGLAAVPCIIHPTMDDRQLARVRVTLHDTAYPWTEKDRVATYGRLAPSGLYSLSRSRHLSPSMIAELKRASVLARPIGDLTADAMLAALFDKVQHDVVPSADAAHVVVRALETAAFDNALHQFFRDAEQNIDALQRAMRSAPRAHIATPRRAQTVRPTKAVVSTVAKKKGEPKAPARRK